MEHHPARTGEPPRERITVRHVSGWLGYEFRRVERRQADRIEHGDPLELAATDHDQADGIEWTPPHVRERMAREA